MHLEINQIVLFFNFEGFLSGIHLPIICTFMLNNGSITKINCYLHGSPLSLSSTLASPLVVGCTGGGIPILPNRSPKLSGCPEGAVKM